MTAIFSRCIRLPYENLVNRKQHGPKQNMPEKQGDSAPPTPSRRLSNRLEFEPPGYSDSSIIPQPRQLCPSRSS